MQTRRPFVAHTRDYLGVTVNFARQPKYMDKFIKAKETLIPKIQYRVKIGDASEDEKKILYGFLLDKETIWKR